MCGEVSVPVCPLTLSKCEVSPLHSLGLEQTHHACLSCSHKVLPGRWWNFFLGICLGWSVPTCPVVCIFNVPYPWDLASLTFTNHPHSALSYRITFQQIQPDVTHRRLPVSPFTCTHLCPASWAFVAALLALQDNSQKQTLPGPLLGDLRWGVAGTFPDALPSTFSSLKYWTSHWPPTCTFSSLSHPLGRAGGMSLSHDPNSGSDLLHPSSLSCLFEPRLGLLLLIDFLEDFGFLYFPFTFLRHIFCARDSKSPRVSSSPTQVWSL